jgi:hypothetical protein
MEEKKVTKDIDPKFYLISAVNLAPCLILGGGFNLDSAVLAAALVVLVINHTILIKIVKSVTQSASGLSDAPLSLGRILVLLGLKFTLLFGLIGLIYFYKKQLLTKLFMIIFFQLIIQVVSIKNNYQNS